jgi:Cysteine-rich secretory protein family
MINERPPDDGHRLNILSSKFTHIGIAVYRDGSGTVWLTQDFSTLAAPCDFDKSRIGPDVIDTAPD